jgi:hypothetical protein
LAQVRSFDLELGKLYKINADRNMPRGMWMHRPDTVFKQVARRRCRDG